MKPHGFPWRLASVRNRIVVLTGILALAAAANTATPQMTGMNSDDRSAPAVSPSGGERVPGQISDTAPAAPPAKLLDGLGSLDHPIATTNPEAQKFFDQGLILIYAFNHAEAARSFARAAELDPREPMPHWGEALALGPNYNATDVDLDAEKSAYEQIQKARALASHAPQTERDYVETLARRFSEDPKADLHSLARDYAAGMRELSRHYVDDPDAATLFAESLMDLDPWQLWTNDGKPAPGTEEIVATLEGVLRRWPNHIGANHFYIHALEASPYPERALASAYRLETLSPAAGHLVHMPSHIFMRSGDYAAAVKSNQEAVAVDRQYLRDRQITNPVYAVGYANHNLHFLAMAAAMDGNYDQAYAAATELAGLAHAAVGPMAGAEAFLPTPIFVQLRFARWDEVLALPAPEAKLTGLTFFWHYARGCAFAAKGQTAQAEAERAALQNVYRQLPSGAAFGMLLNDWATEQSLASESLEARIALARGDAAAAVAHWRTAVATQDQMRYNEPADWYYPLRESLGAALLRSGQLADAEKTFREDLEHNPRNPRSLYGLSKTLEAENKTTDAAWVKASFALAWKGKSEPSLDDF
jgi:tetratricopeptide (TPR) repeat protein